MKATFANAAFEKRFVFVCWQICFGKLNLLGLMRLMSFLSRIKYGINSGGNPLLRFSFITSLAVNSEVIL